MVGVDVELLIPHASLRWVLSILLIFNVVVGSWLLLSRVCDDRASRRTARRLKDGGRRWWKKIMKPRIPVGPDSPIVDRVFYGFLMVVWCFFAVVLLVETVYSGWSAVLVSGRNIWGGLVLVVLTVALFGLYLHFYREAHRIRRHLFGFSS